MNAKLPTDWSQDGMLASGLEFVAMDWPSAGATIFAVYVDGKKDFTELDRAALGSLADLASLALSR
jgi:hypothetical protein